jgi:hypothetical protein
VLQVIENEHLLLDLKSYPLIVYRLAWVNSGHGKQPVSARQGNLVSNMALTIVSVLVGSKFDLPIRLNS